MNVKDLIELLQRADPELPVRIYCGTKVYDVNDDATGFLMGTGDDHFIIDAREERT